MRHPDSASLQFPMEAQNINNFAAKSASANNFYQTLHWSISIGFLLCFSRIPIATLFAIITFQYVITDAAFQRNV
jgi:hypothetical protein